MPLGAPIAPGTRFFTSADSPVTKLILTDRVTTSQNLTKLINQVSSTLIIRYCGVSLHPRQDRELFQNRLSTGKSSYSGGGKLVFLPWGTFPAIIKVGAN
jgi:hypothetical protein